MSQIIEFGMETKNRPRDSYVDIPGVNCNYFELSPDVIWRRCHEFEFRYDVILLLHELECSV
jgi:hypothetical protein